MQKLWFKRKTYGWGWTPASWEGWLVTAIYTLIIVASLLTLDENSPTREIMFTGVLPVVLASITLVRICYARGEKPRWQWGHENNNAE